MNDDNSFPFTNASGFGGYYGIWTSGNASGGDGGFLEIEDYLIGKAYTLSGGGGGAYQGGTAGVSTGGGGNGGSSGQNGANATQVACGGGGRGGNLSGNTGLGGSGYRGEITIRY